MNCEKARELFSEHLEGGGDHALAAARSHIDQCPSCSREFELFKQTWGMLESLPEIELPSTFRHDVVMRVARVQHEQSQAARQRVSWLNWDSMLGRLVPARAVAIACAGAALAILLLRVPPTAYEHLAGMFNPSTEIAEYLEPQRPANAIEASPLSMEGEHKQKWLSRKLGRNTVWVRVSSKENGDGATLYRVMLFINEAALLPGDTTQRIGARVYLLPPNKFDLEDVVAVGPEWEGNILKESPVVVPVMPVIVDQSQGRATSVNLLVTWTFRHRDFAYIIFIPTQKTVSSTRDVFDFSVSGADFARGGTELYPTLQSIAQDYGVPVIANAYLDQDVSVVAFGKESLDEVLMQTLKPIGLDWLFADQAIYVDRKYDVR